MASTPFLLFTVMAALLAMGMAIRQQPLVAFMCNKPSMYLGPNGWVEDRTTDCMSDPERILSYCKKVYPGKDIRNIVEASEEVTIPQWCSYDGRECEHNVVRPYRCLEGVFQSDALLVPQHCLFDHKHGSVCSDWSYWNATAERSCSEHSMKLDNFAVLQPCETARFTGVEFVCCPVDRVVDFPTDVQFQNTNRDPNSVYPQAEQSAGNQEKAYPAFNDANNVIEPVKMDDSDLFRKYLDSDDDDDKYNNEHEFFMKAKGNLVKHHHDKVTKMMKDWAEAREQVQELRRIDPKAAEKLHQEISQRFQKTYEALEQEGQMEKQEVLTVHQQRVQSKLNERKRDAMEEYMEALTEEDPGEQHLMKKLIQYVKIEEKDRQHSVNHFMHLQDTEAPQELAVAKAQFMQHTEIIDERIKEAISMLDRVPKLKDKIRPRVEEYLGTFVELDREIKAVKEMPYAEETPVDMPRQPEIIPLEDIVSDAKPEKYEQPKMSDLRVKEVPVSVEDGYEYDDEIDEDEHDMDRPLVEEPTDHIVDDRMQLQVSSINRDAKTANGLYSSGTTIAMAVAAVAIFVILLVGVLVLRHRSNRHHLPTAVEVATSPEERHVANMQLNGYENPTYRYFEMNAQA